MLITSFFNTHKCISYVVVLWRPTKMKNIAPIKHSAFVYDMTQSLKMKGRLPKFWEFNHRLKKGKLT